MRKASLSTGVGLVGVVGLLTLSSVVGALGLLAASCASESVRNTIEGTDANAPVETEPTVSLGDASSSVETTLKGTVFAPNGTLPLANALVYVSLEAPPEIPQAAFCDECVALPPDTFAFSGSNGSFEIKTRLPTGTVYFVTQKGQFRRVRKLRITKESPSVEIEKEVSTLPGRADRTRGDDVPLMAILKDDFDVDRIDESLNKLGIRDFHIEETRTMLDDESTLMKHHIVFLPCGTQEDPFASSPKAKANVQKFVRAGGKLYVTDYKYEFVRQNFPGYVSWEGETPVIGSAVQDEWAAPATANDKGLADWLAATGDATFTVEGNWTTLSGVHTVTGRDPKGKPAEITPKVWVTANKPDAGARAATVSFPDQCGRVLYSTYHTQAGKTVDSPLLAQEKALLYVLLEVGVCVGDGPGVR